MTPPAIAGRRWLRASLLFLLGTALFTAAYAEAPLYYSNQNQYFLHGLAEAGDGLLRADWLANTRDPTPLFSGLVALTARTLPDWAFYVEYALLLGAYAAAMLALFVALAGPSAARRWPVFVALLVAVHSATARWLSYHLLGLDYPWYFQDGLAGQYVLGPTFQPSTFGVLLIVAVALFAWGRPYLAAVAVAAAATFHFTYLLPGALLVLGFQAALVTERRRRQALAVGALALVLVLPVVVSMGYTFRPTSPETFARAQDILVNVRIPHHTRPDLWIDLIAVLQVLWVGVSLVLVSRTRLFPVLAVPFALMLLLTLVQLATGSLTLALLFPWRISSVLVPIATTIILARLVALVPLPSFRGLTWVVSAVAVLALAVGGVVIMAGRLGFRSSDEEVPLLEFVRRTRAPGQVYFLPVQVPDLAKSTRGSLSSDFKPLAAKRHDARIIPVDLQRFRLATGTPIFVDFKSIPYKDTEVIEWYDRLMLAERVQEQIRRGELPDALEELRRRGVTHLVQPAAQPLADYGLEDVHEDPYYRVYRLKPTPSS